MEIRKFSRRGSRSPDNAEFGHFTLLFCRGRQRNVPKFITHVQKLLFCSSNLLFSDVVVAVAVVYVFWIHIVDHALWLLFTAMPFFTRPKLTQFFRPLTIYRIRQLENNTLLTTICLFIPRSFIAGCRPPQKWSSKSTSDVLIFAFKTA